MAACILIDDISNGAEPIEIPLVIPADSTQADHATPHLDESFRYTSSLVLPDGVKEINDDAAGCSCTPGQCGQPDNDCDCIDEHGLFYDSSGCLNLEAIPPSFPLYECGQSCACRGHCQNAQVQLGVRQACEVRQTAGKGFGLFAKQSMQKGSFLCIYAGQVISTTEARERWERQRTSGASNYILVIREHLQISGELQTLKTTVDPTKIGGIGRFMNHACPPLTTHVMLPVRVVGQLVPLPALFASRDIETGEELTWDYADGGGETWFYRRSSPILDEDGSLEGRSVCRCGSAQCRGWMPYDPTL